ncbi:hypothetical protein Gohar_010030, partial [Gossypium harknessii]|nr:hypothetical protein [Gossypium harknessii]
VLTAETIDHLFRDCPVSVEVWLGLSLSNILNRPELGFAQWLTWNRRTEIAWFIINYIIEINETDRRNLTKEHEAVEWRVHLGRVLISCLEIHDGLSTVFSVEALACHRAVQMGLEMGWSEVTVEGDSLAIRKKCQTHNPNKSQIGAHIQDIQQLKDSFQSIVFKHTPRLANGLAHILAIETLKKSKTDYLVGGAPVYAERVMVVEWVREPD